MEGSKEPKLIVNASKVRRRLDSYFDWMKDNMAKDLAERPLTLESVHEPRKAWGMESSIAIDGRFAWFFDLERMDQKKIKSISTQENLRFIVWYSHLVVFNHKAQENGVIILDNFNNHGFWDGVNLIPMELSTKIDRLTIGGIPLQRKGIIIFGAGRWLHSFMSIFKPFLSKKMPNRIILVTESMAPDRQKYCDDLVGRANLLDGFMGLEGGSQPDAIISKLKRKRRKKPERKVRKRARNKEGEKLEDCLSFMNFYQDV